jgi:signal transduction histidine kinase
LSAPVEAGGEVLGRLECGPRHGGWGAEQQSWVQEVAARVGLLWQNTRLSDALAERVADLEASRRRLVAAEEEARRRLERDLHDGVQQQLVALLVRLELLRALLPPDGRIAEVTASAHELAAGSLVGLRELVCGIRPPLLADRGLVAALQSRAAQLPVPVTVDADPRVDGSRFPAEVESAAYFVALEALTNVLKHAGGSAARVVVTPAGDGLVLTVGDDGRGFDAHAGGTGLAGMRDRVEALGGSLSVTSAVGVGTTVTAHLPGDRGTGG